MTHPPTSATVDDSAAHLPHDEHDDEDGYRGPASVHLDGPDGTPTRFDVEVVVRGHFEPLDGRYHWYGRIAVHAGLEAALGGRKATAVLITPQGSAVGDLSDVDPWGRYRIGGTSTPPFRVGAPDPDTTAEAAR